MSIRVTWAPDVPAEVRAIVDALLPDALRYAPRWVVDLEVRWDDEDADSLAKMSTLVEYRSAILTVAAKYLSATPSERADVLRHEVLHLVVQPLVDVLGDLIDASGADEKLKAWAIEQSRRAQEGVVCDLEIMLRPPEVPATPRRGAAR